MLSAWVKNVYSLSMTTSQNWGISSPIKVRPFGVAEPFVGNLAFVHQVARFFPLYVSTDKMPILSLLPRLFSAQSTDPTITKTKLK